MEQNPLDKLLRQKLEGMSIPPPPDVWARIESSLATGDIPAAQQDSADHHTPPAQPARGRKSIPLRRKLWSYGAAACLLLGMAALWRMNDLKPNQSGNTASETTEIIVLPGESDPAATEIIALNATGISEATEQGGRKPESGSKRISSDAGVKHNVRAALAKTAIPGAAGEETSPASATGKDHSTPATIPGTDTGTHPENPAVKAEQEATTEPQVQRQKTAENDVTRSPAAARPAWYAEAARQNSRKSRSAAARKISASLFADNLTGSSSATSQYGPASAMLSDFSIMESVSSTAPGNVLLYRASEQQTNMRHRTPVTFGTGVSFALNRKFSLETGLLYTKLHSEWESKGTFNYNITQKLHYLGIPLSVNYTIAGNRYLSFYARAGATAEYCVSGKRTRSVVTQQGASNRETTDVEAKGLQTSVGAALGGMFKITPTVGIYVEPGVSHYFANDNQPDSYRTDHPTNFNLRAGLRFSFR